MKYNFGMIPKLVINLPIFFKVKAKVGINKLQTVDSHLLKKKHRLVQAVGNVCTYMQIICTLHAHMHFYNSERLGYIFALKTCPLSYPASIQYQIFTFQNFKRTWYPS